MFLTQFIFFSINILVEILVAYSYKKFPENLDGKYIEDDFLGCSGGKFRGATEHLKKYSLFSE